MLPRIIGIHGPKRSGKHTVADIIQTLADLDYGVEYHEDTFAAPLRAFVCSLLGVSLRTLDEIKEDRFPIGEDEFTIRESMYVVAQNAQFYFGEDLFTTGLMRRLTPSCSYVIPDVRRRQEATAIRQAGGVIVHIRGRGTADPNDKLELGLFPEDGDFFLYNEGSLYQLKDQVELLLQTLDMKGQTNATGK